MPDRRMHYVAACLALAAAAASAGCSRADDPAGPETGVEVLVLRGPLVPVEREGERNAAPVAGARVAAEPIGGGRSRSASTDARGLARFALRPGTYRVSVGTCPGALALPADVKTVSVTAGSLSSVEFECDTGIR